MRCLSILLLLVFSSLVSAQGDPPPPPPPDFVIDQCPEVINCVYSDTEFSGYFPWWDISVTPIDNCGGAPFVQSNLMFEALSSELEVVITWNTDDYMKTGIIEECIQYSPCVVSSLCEDDGEITIYTDELTIGHTYLLYVDACGTYEFGYDVELKPGPIEEFDAIDLVWLAKQRNCDNGLEESKYCEGTMLYTHIGGPDEGELEYFSEQEGVWRFSIDGPITELLEVENPNELELAFDIPGTYVFTLLSVKFNCEEYLINASYEFEILNIDEHFGIYEICEHELDDWKPEEAWRGPEISEPGYYIFEYHDECDCPYIQDIEIIELEEIIGEYELVLCPDDYPYEFFDGYELDYKPYDYDLYLRFDDESLIEDYDGENCDSLIHLYVINENPEDRCSSCELPVSLKKSKIIYCVPFDNGTYDVSGKNNRIYAEGVGYENNGPASNELWEAEFDGKDDHVWIPHIDDLNTSAFAIDLRFKKEAKFGDEKTEVIMSKGDRMEDNARFVIEVEETNDDEFKLLGRFYTETEEILIRIDSLKRGEWYGTTLVVEQDSISLYLDGILKETRYKTEDLKGNENRLYLATGENNGVLDHFYEGSLDDFKYWKQKLSGQDVLYLYYPEKEFEVSVDMFLRCCDSAVFRDILIDKENPRDTLIVEEASSTGYDSVYFLNMIEIEDGPKINYELIPSDVLITKNIKCNEACEEWVEWTEPPIEIFSDLCGIQKLERSHESPILLNESLSFVELVYTATNMCGKSNSFSFSLELQCESEDFAQLPKGNDFVVMDAFGCSGEESYCIGNQLSLNLFYTETIDIDYEQYDSLKYVVSINGVEKEVIVHDQEDFSYDLDLNTVGNYTVCYESLESECDKVEVNKCQQVKVREGAILDHGLVIACQGKLEEVLPQGIGEELMNILKDPSIEGYLETISEDACSCLITESIEVFYREEHIEEQSYNVCRDDLPIQIFGEEFGDDEVFTQTEIVFAGMSEQLDSNGNNCDSTVLLTINVYEDLFTEMSVEICEGEEYRGYSEAGTYTDHYLSGSGCDSTVLLMLSVLESKQEFIDAQICEGESLYGYEQSGSYVDILVAENGCDSVRHLELKVIENNTEELYVDICPGEAYNAYTESGVYEETYIDSEGCDSIVIIHLTVLEEEHVDCFVSASLDQSIEKLNVYPNPVRGVLFIDCQYKIRDIEIFNIESKLIMSCQSLSGRTRINTEQLIQGLYIVKIKMDTGEEVLKKILVN